MKRIPEIATMFLGGISLLLVLVVGCTRNINVATAPNSISTATFTPTPTFTPVFTSTFTNTPTKTFTPTITSTPTITNTPAPATSTFTFTVTPTPTVNLGMISDFESASPNANPGPASNWNGAWQVSNDGSTPISLFIVAPGAYGSSAYCMQVTCGPATQYAIASLTFRTPASVSNSSNLSAYTGIVFDAIANGGSATLIAVSISDSDTNIAGGVCTTNCYNSHETAATLSTSWAPVTVYFSQLVQPNSALGPYPVTFKSNAVYGITFNFPTGKSFNVSFDNIRLITTPPPASTSGSKVISDFENGTYTINPNLQGLPAGAYGFSYYVGNGGTQSPFVQSPGFSSLYALRMVGSWTDPANGSYPSAGPAAHFNAPGNTTNMLDVSSFTGARFDMKITALSTTGATPPTMGFSGITPSMVPPPGGTCGGGCYDYFNASLPATVMGWQPVTVAFSSFTRACCWGGALTGQGGAPCNYTNFADGCNNKFVMSFGWAASGNNIAGTYTFDYSLDNITLY